MGCCAVSEPHPPPNPPLAPLTGKLTQPLWSAPTVPLVPLKRQSPEEGTGLGVGVAAVFQGYPVVGPRGRPCEF